MFQRSDDIFNNYSPVSTDQLLRQNVVNYLERESSFEIDERPNSSSSRHNGNIIDNDNTQGKRHGDELMCSYVKKPRKTSTQSKIIRLQIFEVEELKNSVCKCKASVCAQHVVDNVYSDEVYRHTKDLLSKIHRKLL